MTVAGIRSIDKLLHPRILLLQVDKSPCKPYIALIGEQGDLLNTDRCTVTSEAHNLCLGYLDLYKLQDYSITLSSL